MRYKYEPIDRYVWLNVLNPYTLERDPKLTPIRVDQLDLIKRTFRQYGFPEPDDFPDMKKVIGYGLNPQDQVFHREETHEGIIKLELELRNKERKNKRVSTVRKELNIIENFWETLQENPGKYQSEIEWLRKIWHYRLFGYFFFCDGKVTYITGSNWVYLNYWKLDTITPDYRDRDRRWYVGQKYAQTDTTTFKYWIETAGKRTPVPNEDGSYEMIDLGRNVCLGSSDPKGRRMGDTSKCCEDSFEYITRVRGQHFGFQGKNEVHSKTKFQENIALPFSTFPFFLKPLWDSGVGMQPKEKLLFESDESGLGIHTRISHATTAKSEHYNSDRLDRYVRDESGNTKGECIDTGHDTVKQCFKVGSILRGFCYYPTTIEDMEDIEAGKHYLQLLKNSMWNERSETGQTISGLYNFFFSAADGREGQIGKFGESIIDKPTPEQAAFTGREIGAKKEIEQERKELTRTKQWDKLSKAKRQYPLIFQEVFSPPVLNTFFRTDLIEAYVSKLWAYPENCARRVDLFWEKVDETVGVTDNPESGRFYISRRFSEGEINLKYKQNGQWVPTHPFLFIATADTFKSDKPQGRASKGGLCVRERRNPLIDPPEKDISQCQTERTIITYSVRPEKVEDFCEDCIMVCVLTGAMMYAERNLDNVNRHFIDRGFGGYLLYDYDEKGNRKNEAGFWSNADTKHEMFVLMKTDHIKTINRVPHPDLWEESLQITAPDELTDYDLTAAYGGTLLAERNRFYKFFQPQTSMNRTDIFTPKRY